jgi:2-polyprenyl-6-methoxyphenol 4-hydroxylase
MFVTELDYDVVIAGGGMTGASLALLLCHQSQGSIRVLMVESFPLPEANNTEPVYSPAFDARSSALSYGTAEIFKKIGVWQSLSAHVSAIDSIHVSNKGQLGSVKMDKREMNWPALGYVVENSWLGNVLMNQLHRQEKLQVLAPASVESIQPRHDHVELTVDEGGEKRKLKTQLMVIADGAESPLREQLGISCKVSDYQQTAVIANVCFSQPHQHYAFERFTDQGPMALLPLPDSDQNEARAALVWTMDNEQAKQLLAADDESFLEQLQQRFGHRLGEFIRVGNKASYPLKLMEASEQIRSSIVVMGNAAHSLHPVAGQGFNLALRDCARLSGLLVAAQQKQQPLGELSLLQAYVDSQQFDQAKTISFSDKMSTLFSDQQLLHSAFRNLGLLSLDLLPSVKKTLIRHAAGFHDGAALAYEQ